MMKEGPSKKYFPILFFLISLFSGVKETLPSAPNFNFDIQSHHLNIQIDPSEHFIKAEDRLETQFKDKKAQTLSFLLHPELRILRIVNLKTGNPLRWFEASVSAQAKRLDISLEEAEKSLSLSISYEGYIYDPVVKETGLQFVRGDQTSGLIGLEGVYLSSSSHWYPDRPGSMATFNVEAIIAQPFRIITQGELLSEELKDGFWNSRWSYQLPTEGLTLVAGKYSVKNRDVDGIKISTYFFPEDDRFSEIFLNAAKEYLKIYSDLLGPYPYKKFDIVQNFFSSGYSFPTFTLLAPEAIRQGKEFLRPGALDHEIVHSWWGHYVSGRAATGNWVEALTTYCTNYYYKELKMGEEIARKHRQEVMQKYTVQVPFAKDYPLRQFKEKREELDGQIGYGKGSMVFHMLREMVGKDLFFSTLRKFSMRSGGKQADWEDIQEIFEEASGRRLNGFFSQWLDRPGGPQLKLENVGVQVTSKGYLISGEVVQEGEVYQLLLPVEVDDGIGEKSLIWEVSRRRNFFSMEVPKIPLSLTLDPDHHLFRRLYPEEIIPGLNVLLEDREKIFILPDHGDEEQRKIYFELARMAKEKKGGEIIPVKEMMKEKILNCSLMLFGESWKNPIFSDLISNLPRPISLKDNKFIVNGDRVDEADESLLITYPHPLRPGKWVTIYFGQSAAGLSRARYIFYYGWDSYILFRNGRPVIRGNFPSPHSPVSHDFLLQGHLDEIEGERLRNHISYLASPEIAGRFPGTSGYHQAQRYLVRQLEEIGMTPIFQPFVITVKDIEDIFLRLMAPEKEEKPRSIPFIFSKEGEWKGPCSFFDDQEVDKVQDLEGRAAIYLLKSPENQFDEILLAKIRELQFRKASAVLFLIKEEDLDHISPYITYPSYFPPQLEERMKNREKEGYYFNRLIEASKVVARGKELDFPVHIPIFFIPYTQGEEGWMKNLLGRKDASLEIGLRFREMRFRDLNIGGIIEGHDPEKKKEYLILGAHYDHLGKDEKSGFYYPGADDNASGVSALLEIGRSLKRRKVDLRRSLILLFIGGEEWGLRGSYRFVENPFIHFSQIKAMLSVDSIGGLVHPKEVFFIGSSIYPSLSQRSRRFLRRLGIKEGREIDRHAFAFGSDHFPFHQKGIPALDYFASDYRKLHTPYDNLESIDFEKLTDMTRLIYLTVYEFLTEP